MKIEPIPSPVKKLISKLNYAIIEHDCNPNPENRKVVRELTSEIKMRQRYAGQRFI
jgi:hypothetical protein